VAPVFFIVAGLIRVPVEAGLISPSGLMNLTARG
jgi:hypothetical protein